MTNSKCLITGGAGFMGSHLAEALLNKGDEVFCVDNFITGSKKNVEHLLGNPQFHLVEWDVIKPLDQASSSNIQTPNFIYHLASPASPVQYQKYPIETLLVNSVGTYHMLNLAKETGAKFLLASTSEVYGDPKVHPQPESYWGNVNPVGRRSCYDEGKRFAEAMVMAFIRKSDLDARIARIFNTYGPRMQKNDGRVVSNFIGQALSGQPLTVYGDGSQTRSFCYVLDMVEGLMTLMKNEKSRGEIFNLGNPEERRVLEIAKLIKNLTGSSSEIKFTALPEDDPARRRPDISRAQKILGWQPKVPLEQGLKHTLAYFRNL